MITAAQCKTYLSECEMLGTKADISIQRATAILAVRRAWVVLAQQVARYDAVRTKKTVAPCQQPRPDK